LSEQDLIDELEARGVDIKKLDSKQAMVNKALSL